ncbi:CarD family transcriptional regulator [bacterium]|nr:CarD family transcriptional regulator [bacterium]MCG2761930.1 CarD family transcriptional regulator [Candidatus Atribacteria bacterium]
MSNGFKKSKIMFKIGDKVSHPSFGVGDIEKIEEKKVLGQKEKYYILKLMVNEMTLMVPINKAEEIGLRYIIDPETVPDVLNVLSDRIDDEMHENYKQRIRSQTEMVDSGDILKVAQVVKNYTHRGTEEKLSSTERGLFERARKILVGEISVACNIEKNKAKYIIKEAVSKSEKKEQTKSH